MKMSESFHIYLYKETKHFQYISNIDEKKHYYFNIRVLATEINKKFGIQDTIQAIYDYIFICFMCGNDFTPHIPCINIRNNGIFSLIENYKETNKPLIHTKTRTILWKHFHE